MALPNLIVADGMGNFIEVPELSMAGMNFIRPVAPVESLLLPLPPVTQLVVLPGRVAMGYDPELNKFVQVREYQGRPVYPVSAVLPHNYLQILRPAYSTLLDAPRLAPNTYSAVGIADGRFVASGGFSVNDTTAERNFLLINHLTDARERSIDRAVSHLNNAANGAVRFVTENRSHAGQITEIVAAIREQTSEGIIQIDSNAGNADIARQWCAAGADRLRVRINSAQESFYNRYFAELGYTFPDLIQTLEGIAAAHKETEIAYLVFPGLTDHPDELSAITELVGTINPNRVVLENMAIDPDWYMDELRLFHLPRTQLGIPEWVQNIRQKLKKVFIGDV
ncbi:MAG: hypothetical protein KDI06_17195 [Calditrichaeota bacterium]|nr:hypothetical protein [Calditrichota bacterium]HQU71112.1 hypothetical protein [Calditrichia bacterium]